MRIKLEKTIRVLQILGIVANGGVEAVIMNYYRNIDKRKIQFDFVVHNDADENYIKEVLSMGAKVYKVTPYNQNVFKFMYEIYHIIKSNQYQIVHSNMNALSGFALLPAYLAGAKIRILHNHTTDSKEEKLRSLIKRVLRPFAKLFANQYWACSKLAAEWMYGRNASTNGKITIINNAIDLEKFKFNREKRKQLRKELGLENCFVIGHVGRFVKQKNHIFILNFFVRFHQKYPNSKLWLIGEGPLKKEVEHKIMKLGIIDSVELLGVRENVNQFMMAADCLLFPSIFEGLGIVAVEAQTSGMLTIVSNNIPIEANISSLFHQLPLNVEKWVSEVEYLLEYERGKENVASQSGYDVKETASWLQNFYLENFS